MIVSLAELLVLGLIVDWAFRRMTVPGLVGMLFLGLLFGPYVLGWVNPELLAVSGDFRLIALIVILLRAGFELSKDTLNRVGGRVLLLATVPAIVDGVTAARSVAVVEHRVHEELEADINLAAVTGEQGETSGHPGPGAGSADGDAASVHAKVVGRL